MAAEHKPRPGLVLAEALAPAHQLPGGVRDEFARREIELIDDISMG